MVASSVSRYLVFLLSQAFPQIVHEAFFFLTVSVQLTNHTSGPKIVKRIELVTCLKAKEKKSNRILQLGGVLYPEKIWVQRLFLLYYKG